MTTIHMQPPTGGCINCGRPVRTMKDGEWLCWRCHRTEEQRQLAAKKGTG